MNSLLPLHVETDRSDLESMKEVSGRTAAVPSEGTLAPKPYSPRQKACPSVPPASLPVQEELTPPPPPQTAEGKQDRECTQRPDGFVPLGILNQQAAVLENVFFPAQVLAALSLDDKASVTAVRLFLARFREEAGQAEDAVEKVLLDQLIVTHLKVGELYALAAGNTNLEFKRMYTNAAARLVGTICQLVSTLTSYRSSTRSRNRAQMLSEETREPGSPTGPGKKKVRTRKASTRGESV